MIDLHSHILFGIDDGPATIEESLALAASYEEAGFSKVVATPHWINGTAWMAGWEDIRNRVAQFNVHVQDMGMRIRIYPGMEIALDGEIPALLSRNRLMPLADTSYLLIEPPFQRLPENWEDIFFSIAAKGYRIVLAHPERCAQIIARPELADDLINTGVYFQSNYDSFAKNYGDQIFHTAKNLLRKGYVHCLATDSHDSVHRHPGNVANAVRNLKKLIDNDILDLITRINPERLISGLPMTPPQPMETPSPAKGRKRWRFF